MPIMISKESCNGCKICIEVCPVQALSIGPDGKVKVSEKCVGCMTCVGTCPRMAILEW